MKAVSGATIIIVDCNPKALALAKKIGANYTVLVKDDESLVKEVLDITKGKAAEAAINFVIEGGSTKTGVKILRRNGDYYIIGYGEDLQIPTVSDPVHNRDTFGHECCPGRVSRREAEAQAHPGNPIRR
jgi:NAD+-dependent secondary alcohol dehydrogenase Adh1